MKSRHREPLIPAQTFNQAAMRWSDDSDAKDKNEEGKHGQKKHDNHFTPP